MTDSHRLPVDSPEFWKTRLDQALERRELHRAVWDTDEDNWNRVNNRHRALLHSLLGGSVKRIRVLDCGCGIGTLIGLLPGEVVYRGVDISPELVTMARRLNPAFVDDLSVADLRALPYPDGAFDVAVCRSLEGMVIGNLGAGEWRKMEQEIHRVADRVILIGYATPNIAHVSDSPRVKRVKWQGEMVTHGGRLVYRDGQDDTAEIFDIFVEEGYRGRGVGRELVDRLLAEFRSVFAFTRETNEGAMRFYRALGFSEVRVPGFYRGMDALFYSKSADRGIVSVDPLR